MFERKERITSKEVLEAAAEVDFVSDKYFFKPVPGLLGGKRPVRVKAHTRKGKPVRESVQLRKASTTKAEQHVDKLIDKSNLKQYCKPETVAGIRKAMVDMFASYPQLAGVVKGISLRNDMPNKAWACWKPAGQGFYDPNTIGLNFSYWAGNHINYLAERVKASVDTGWHPPALTPYSVITHELGHALNEAMMGPLNRMPFLDPFKDWKNYDKLASKVSQISEYARKNDLEAFAETMIWIKHVAQSKWPEPVKIINSAFKNMKRKAA